LTGVAFLLASATLLASSMLPYMQIQPIGVLITIGLFRLVCGYGLLRVWYWSRLATIGLLIASTPMLLVWFDYAQLPINVIALVVVSVLFIVEIIIAVALSINEEVRDVYTKPEHHNTSVSFVNNYHQSRSVTLPPPPPPGTQPDAKQPRILYQPQGCTDIPGLTIDSVLTSHEERRVFLAHVSDDPNQRLVVKLASERQSQYILNEAALLPDIEHRNIIRMIPPPNNSATLVNEFTDRDTAQSFRYIALEYMPGGSLRDNLNEGTLEERIGVFKQTAQAVEYLHENNILHLDIKPANVLLGAGNRVVLTDFGVSQYMQDAQNMLKVVIGTYAYMAPERWDNYDVDTLSDIYSLGVLLAELVLGQPLRFDKTDGIKKYKNYRITEKILQGLPSGIRTIVLKATNEDKGQRYQTVQDMLRALEAWQRKSLYLKQATYISQLRRVIRTLQVAAIPAGIVLVLLVVLLDLLAIFFLLSEVVYPAIAAIFDPLLFLLRSYPLSASGVILALNVIGVLFLMRNEIVQSDHANAKHHRTSAAVPKTLTPPIQHDFHEDTDVTQAIQDVTQTHTIPGTPTGGIIPSDQAYSEELTSPLTESAIITAEDTDAHIEIPDDKEPLARLIPQTKGMKPLPYEILTDMFTIGRSRKCNLQIDKPHASGQHASISFNTQSADVKFYITDTSENGTFVNGQPISVCDLEDGDEIVIAGQRYVFEYTRTYRNLRRYRVLLQGMSVALESDKPIAFHDWVQETSILIKELLDIPMVQEIAHTIWYAAFSLDVEKIFGNTYISSRLSLVFVQREDVSLDQITEIYTALEKESNTEDVVFLLVLPYQRSSETKSIESWKVRAHIAIPMDQNRIEYLILSRSPHDALRRFVVEHMDLQLLSPYGRTSTASRTISSLFFGRDKELQNVASRCHISSFAVIGGRRIGKTSFLHRLHHQRLPGNNIASIYHDCSNTETLTKFMRSRILASQPGSLFAELGFETFQDLLDNLPLRTPIVLLLDEADKLIPANGRGDWEILNLLRSLSATGHIQVVLCGELTLREAMRNHDSPLFNFVSEEIVIGRLEFHEVRDFIRKPLKQMGIRFASAAEYTIIQYMYDVTSGHPYVVQRLCEKIIKNVNKGGKDRVIHFQDIDTVLKSLDFVQHDVLGTYWGGALTLERIVLLIMIVNTEARTASSIRDLLKDRYELHPQIREINQALQNLVYLRSILRYSDEGYYTFDAGAVERLAAQEKLLCDLIESEVEEYKYSQQDRNGI
jgi:serine/threonine protein kinase